MSVVVLGGHERMKRKYKDIGKQYGVKVKTFIFAKSKLNKRIGNPDYMLILMNTISHKAANIALKSCKNNNIPVIKINNNSVNALKNALSKLV